MASTHMTISVEKWPEALWAMRQAMARLLREQCEGEPEVVQRKLREIAAAFEAGASEV